MKTSVSPTSELEHSQAAGSGAGAPQGPSSPEGAPLRTKTLPFPVPQNPHDLQGPESHAPFLLELERETTWRFIGNTPRNPGQPKDTGYTVELVDLPGEPQPH